MDNNERSVRTNYVFIDYESVQPASLALTKDYPFMVILFVGANQTKIPIELATSMQALGNNAEYVKIEGSGKNALDFHITFYCGRLFEKDQNGYFHIISRDSGFDILIKHLRDKNILIQRHNQISDIPLLKISSSKSLNEKIEIIVDYLISRGNAKPRKITTLSNAINALFMRNLDPEEPEKMIKELIRRNLIVTEDIKVHYNLASEKL